MCRNITTLRGLEPQATDEEIEAAARQFVRKISGMTKPSKANEERFEEAVRDIAAISTALLADLPPRKNPPPTEPPLRRIARAKAEQSHDHDHEHPHDHGHTHTHDHQPA